MKKCPTGTMRKGNRCIKNRFSHTDEYNIRYWDMMESKKNYEMVDKKQSPQLKLFFKRIYQKKRNNLKKEFGE